MMAKLPTLEEMGEETAKWALDNVLHNGKTIREWAAIIRDLNSCDDAISREAAVHACTNGWNKDYKEIMADIRALPPVQPKQSEGHWIDVQGLFFCSECDNGFGEVFHWNYCPNCGAKMKEDNNGTA